VTAGSRECSWLVAHAWPSQRASRLLGLPSRRELNQLPTGAAGGIVPGMELGFRGEVADFYHRYRHVSVIT